MKRKILKNCQFIVSCQALKGEPMYGAGVVLKMCHAAMDGGAQGLRLSQIPNIQAVLKANFQVPIIGIIKKNYGNNPVFITPTLTELKKLILSGVDIIAVDATLRTRPKQSLEVLVEYFKNHKQSHQKLMADCSDYDDVKNAIKLKFDFIGTTLRGYTNQTQNQSNADKNCQFIQDVVALCKEAKIPVIAEGGFNTPELAKAALVAGADAVVVGSAITRPQFITKMFAKHIQNKLK